MILQEMAKALERVSQRQDDIYKALEPIMKSTASQRVAMSFDQAVMNQLKHLCKSEIGVLEAEAQIQYSDGMTALNSKRGRIGPNEESATFARSMLPQIAKGDIDRTLEKHVISALTQAEDKVLSRMEQVTRACLSKVTVEVSRLMDEKTNDVVRNISKFRREAKVISEQVEGIRDAAPGLVEKVARKEIDKVKSMINEDLEKKRNQTERLTANIEKNLVDMEGSKKRVERSIESMDSLAKFVDSKLEKVFKSAAEQAADQEAKVQKRLQDELTKNSNNISNLLAKLEETRSKTGIRYEEAISPKIQDLKDSVQKKVDELDKAKKDLETLEASIAPTILATKKVVAQVSNTLPNKSKKVFINVRRNN